MSEPRTSIRGLLHDANDELSVAVMELELLLEGPGLDGAARESLASSLEACRRAAGSLKQVWRELGSSGEGG